MKNGEENYEELKIEREILKVENIRLKKILATLIESIKIESL